MFHFASLYEQRPLKKKKSLRGQKRKRIVERALGWLLGWEAGRRLLQCSRQKPGWAPGLPSEMQSRPGPASGGGGGSLCRTDGELLWETFQPRAARSPGFKGLLTAARACSPLPGRQSGLQGVAGREPENMTRSGWTPGFSLASRPRTAQETPSLRTEFRGGSPRFLSLPTTPLPFLRPTLASF